MKRILSILLTLSIFVSSCSLPGENEPSAEIATAAALTVEASLNNQSPFATLDPGSALAASPTATVDTSSKPFASFEDVTNCRTGPGVIYERITQITPGFSVEIIGFFPPNYWVVQTDAGPCWVAGEFVTPSGITSTVPTVTAPPTPKVEAPQGVSLQEYKIDCDYVTNEARVSIIWSDEGDEAGYRIVRNDVVIAELPADTTQFQETITLLSGQTVGYVIIAFNGAGQNPSTVIVLGC